MTAALGIDIGIQRTGWSRCGPGDAAVVVGSVPSVAYVGGYTVGGFVERLGDPTPVMVGSTPYGAESLVAVIVGVALAASGMARRVGLAHPRSIGDYRLGLLVESVRLAGVALVDLLLVPDDVALAAAEAAGLSGELAVVGGAALVAAGQRTDEPLAEGVRWASTLAVAGGAAVGGLAAGSATASAAGEVIAPAGYTGVPLAPPAAAPIVYAGVPLLAPAAATTGAPLAAPAAASDGATLAGSGVGFDGVAVPPVRTGPGRLPAIIGVAVLGVIAIVGAVVVASQSDDAPAPAASVTAAVTIPLIELTTTVDGVDEVATSTTLAAATPSTESVTTTSVVETSSTVDAGPASVTDLTGGWTVTAPVCSPVGCLLPSDGQPSLTVSELDPTLGTFVATANQGGALQTASGTIVDGAVTFQFAIAGFPGIDAMILTLTLSDDGSTMQGTWTLSPDPLLSGQVTMIRAA